MENQGRRPDQEEYNETAAFWAFVAMIAMVAVIAVLG
jgi:hypothetical protein